MLTVNNKPRAFYGMINTRWTYDPVMQLKVRYITGQLEIGENDHRLHQQVYIELLEPMSGVQLKKLLGERFQQVHFEEAIGSQATCIAYVNKLETRAPGAEPWAFGERAKEKGGADPKSSITQQIAELLRTGQKTVAQLCMDPQYSSYMLQFSRRCREFESTVVTQRSQNVSPLNPKTCYLLWGDTGTGKSYWVHERWRPEEYCFITPSGSSGRPGHPWFGDYDPDNHKVVVFDEMPFCLNVDLFLTLTTPFKMCVQTKHGSVVWKPQILIFTSNLPLNQWYPGILEDTRRAVCDRFPEAKYIKHFARAPGAPSLRQVHAPADALGVDDIPVRPDVTGSATPERRFVTDAQIKKMIDDAVAAEEDYEENEEPLDDALLPADDDDDENHSGSESEDDAAARDKRLRSSDDDDTE